MLIWSREPFVSALGLSLLHSLWQGAAVGGVGLVLNARLKRLTPGGRYSIFCLLLLTFFAAWLCSLAVLYRAEMRLVSFHSLTPPASVSATFAPFTVKAEAQSEQGWRAALPFCAAFWLAGITMLSLRHLGGVVALHRLRRRATTPCPPEWQVRVRTLAARFGLHQKLVVLLCSEIDVPLTFGVIKRYILLPPSALLGLAPEQLEALIAHELAHIQQHDTLINLIQICVETVLFYHPVVWWLSTRIRAAREQRCDDLAIQVVGDRTLYVRALFSMEELRASISHLALGAKGDSTKMTNHHLLHRIQRVLAVKDPEKRAPWITCAATLCTATLGAAILWPVQAQSAATHNGKKPALVAKAKKQDDQTKTITGMTVLLNVDGKQIILPTLDLTPETHIKVDGRAVRFGDLPDTEQQSLRQYMTLAGKAAGVDLNDAAVLHMTDGAGTGILLNINGKEIQLKSLDLTPETQLTVNDRAARFGDLSQEEQEGIRQSVVAAKSAMPTGGVILKEVRSSLDGLDLPEEVKTQVLEKVRAKVHELRLGNDQAKVFGDKLKPDTLVAINGVKSKFKSLSTQQQKRLLAAWNHSSQVTRQ